VTLGQLQELHFAFSERLISLKLILETEDVKHVTVNDFATVVDLIYKAIAAEEPWPLTLELTKGARDILIRLVTAFVPFEESVVDQLYELESKYLLLVLRDPYTKGEDHRYPERFAEYHAKQVDRFHGYQTLMEKDKYAFQAHVEDNYVRMAEEEIAMFVEARESFYRNIRGLRHQKEEKEDSSE
jgi:hypothetical protein